MDRGCALVLEREYYKELSPYILGANKDLILDLRYIGGGLF